MEPTIALFLERLEQSRLMTAAEVAALRDKIPADQLTRDSQHFARELVQQRRLTRYQAAALYQGKIRGLVLGNYVVLERIGAGGMGEVFKARHRRLDRLAAVKVLPPRRLDSPDAVRRFHQEVRAVAKLVHPNIVIAHDADEDDGIHYLVMEYIEGRDMGQVVKQDGRPELAGGIPVNTALDYLLQAAIGLQYAHSRGIVHRDVKPRNLLVDNHGVVKILDLGLARDDSPEAREAAEPLEDVTHAGQIMGSVDFMAPEQAIDSRHAEPRSDIYSLGCTLYALLTAGVPYKADTVVGKIVAHRDRPIPSLCEIRPDVPPRVDGLFRRLLAKDPKDRPENMGAVVAELRACLRLLEHTDIEPPPVAVRSEAASPRSTLAPPAPPRRAGERVIELVSDSQADGSTPSASKPAPPRRSSAPPPPPLAGDTDRACEPTVVESSGSVEEIEIVDDIAEPQPGQPAWKFTPSAETEPAEGMEVIDAIEVIEPDDAAPAELLEAEPPAPPVPSGPSPFALALGAALEWLAEWGVVLFAVLALVGVATFLGYLIFGEPNRPPRPITDPPPVVAPQDPAAAPQDAEDSPDEIPDEAIDDPFSS